MKVIQSADDVARQFGERKQIREILRTAGRKTRPAVCPTCGNARQVIANPLNETGAQEFLPCPDCQKS